MPELKANKKLKKELRLLDVYAIATGTTLSAGFFLLPGIAAQQAGEGMVLAYFIAALALIPAMFSIIELSTAMPRSGGVYYFLDRSLGPFFGTIGGIGTYLVLILKVAFSLIGMGVYIAIFFPTIPIIPLAIILALILGALNFAGSKKSGSVQIIMLGMLLILLAIFIVSGLSNSTTISYTKIFSSDFKSLIGTAGLVYISYAGITKVTSLSEEIHNPEKNIPLGLFLSLITSVIIYLLGTYVMVKVIPIESLAGDLAPVATAGRIILGRTGEIILSSAALLAFISVANAGILSASRYPLAMSRDHIFPRFLQSLSKNGSPVVSIVFTVAIIVLILFLFDPTKIAKLASAFQLLMFAFVCLAVIIMRESKIESYDPGYKSPLYPWMQISGIAISFWIIYVMGLMPIGFSSGLIILGFLWYWYYAKDRVVRNGAIYHIFERLGHARYHGLDRELRGILKEKGLREEDPFDLIVARSFVIDINVSTDFETVVKKSSVWLSQFVTHTHEELEREFLEGTRIGATPVTHNIALPHLRMKGFQQPEMVLVRCKKGITITLNNPLTDFEEKKEIVNAIFFLVSPESNPAQHLRMLAQIASRVDEESFALDWELASSEQQLKEVLLHEERYFTLIINSETSSKVLIGKRLADVNLPEGCLVTWMRRSDLELLAHGNTILQEGDVMTIIGEPEGINEIRKKFS
jgi:basic amino acid/polyamine antiporter, APA family